MMFLNNVSQNDMQTRWSFCGRNNNCINTSSYFYNGQAFQLTQTTTSTTACSIAVLNSYQMEFCLPLNLTTLGLNSKKAFPIGLLIDKLILELTFD